MNHPASVIHRSLLSIALGLGGLGVVVACGKDDGAKHERSVADGGRGGEEVGGSGTGAVTSGGAVASGGTGGIAFGGTAGSGENASGGTGPGPGGATVDGGAGAAGHAGTAGIPQTGAGGNGEAGAAGNAPTGTGGVAAAGAAAEGGAAGQLVAGGAAGLEGGGAGGAGGSVPAGPPLWRWENPIPSGWSVDALWGSAADDVYAVGAYGNLLHWDGLVWREAFIGDQGDYAGIWGSSATDIHVVGRSLTQILHYDGTQWAPEVNPAGVPLRAVWGSSATDVYAVGGSGWGSSTQGVLVHYAGDEWSVVRSDFTAILTAVWGSGPGDLFIGGDAGTVVHFDGATYTPLTGVTGSVTGIVGGGAAEDVLLFDDSGYWYRYDRTGAEVTTEGQLPGARGAWGTSPSDVWVAAGPAGVQHYDGDAWTAETLPGSTAAYDLHAVWGAADGTLFVGGWGAAGWDSAALLRQVAGEWTDDSELLTADEFRDVWALSSTLAYASGDGGTLARWDGQRWSLVDLGVTTGLNSVWASDPDFVVVCSRSDTVYQFDGQDWTPVVIDGASNLLHVRGSSRTDVYVAGGGYDAPQLYHFEGATWTPLASPATLRYIDEIWVDPSTRTLVVVGASSTNDTGVFVRAPTDTDWTQLSTPLFAAARAVSGTSMSDLYVATSDDIFHYDGVEFSHAVDNPTTGYFTSLWARASDDVWAAAYDSVIMHYDGVSWTTVQNRQSGWELMAVHGSAADDVLVVGESGTILRYAPE